MPGQQIELHAVNQIVIDAVGSPGQRVFLLQASDALDTITLKLEKEQARALAHTALDLLSNLEEEFPADASAPAVSPDALALRPPMEPLFAVGQIGLGYDRERDRVVLAVQELLLEQDLEPSTARFWITRPQMATMSEYALTVVEQGRPICPLCERPIDPEGHFCPKRNGHDRIPAQ